MSKPTSSPSLPWIAELVALVGEKNVLTEPGERFFYSFDSALDRAIPSAVVIPQTPEQVAGIVRILARYKKPFVARGAATSLCGGPVPLHSAVVIALAKLTRISAINAARREVVVEPGVINLRLQNAIAGDNLFYPPDPGSQKACTIGGNVATNAGGPHCLKYGVTSQFVQGLEIVLPDGQVLQTGVDEPGYDLTGLFVGSEGTLGIVTRVRLKLLPKPKFIRTMLVSFSSIEDAIQSVTDIIGAGLLPATLEAMDKTTVAAVEAFSHAGYPLDAAAVLLIEIDGDMAADLDRQAQQINEFCQKNKSRDYRFAKDEAERAKLWEGRRGAYAAMARLAPNVLVEDGAVPRTRLPEALRRIKKIAEDAGLRVALLFHAGDGNLHPQIIFDERDVEQTRIVKEAGYQMLKACVDLGGTISGEHGIGIDKREAMKWLFSRETLALFRRIKMAFDPENQCNPDKLIPLVSKPAAVVDKDLDGDIEAPDGLITPVSVEALLPAVRHLARRKSFFGIQGSGSRYRVRESFVVSTKKINRILEIDPGNLTVTVEAGASLAAVRTAVEKEKRYLWVHGGGTVGGVVATRASAVPPVRDMILAMRVLLPTGEMVEFGAKTMKNVAGYDAARLLVGSWGTLGLIVDVTFRLFSMPAPELRGADTKPFLFRDIHRKIKKAFDPDSVLSQRMTMLTAADITSHPKGEQMGGVEGSGDVPKNIRDKFWL